MMQNNRKNVAETFEPQATSWASEVINTLLEVKQRSTDIPAGYSIEGIAIREPNKGVVNITFVFKEVQV